MTRYARDFPRDVMTRLTPGEVDQLAWLSRDATYSGMHVVCDVCRRLEPECQCPAPNPPSWWRRLFSRKD